MTAKPFLGSFELMVLLAIIRLGLPQLERGCA